MYKLDWDQFNASSNETHEVAGQWALAQPSPPSNALKGSAALEGGIHQQELLPSDPCPLLTAFILQEVQKSELAHGSLKEYCFLIIIRFLN